MDGLGDLEYTGSPRDLRGTAESPAHSGSSEEPSSRPRTEPRRGPARAGRVRRNTQVPSLAPKLLPKQSPGKVFLPRGDSRELIQGAGDQAQVPAG